MILRDIAVVFTVEIPATNFERVLAELSRYVVNRVLDSEHSLRTTETAECRVGNCVRLTAMRQDPNVLEIIGIITMKHCPVIDGPGQIGGHSAA